MEKVMKVLFSWYTNNEGYYTGIYNNNYLLLDKNNFEFYGVIPQIENIEEPYFVGHIIDNDEDCCKFFFEVKMTKEEFDNLKINNDNIKIVGFDYGKKSNKKKLIGFGILGLCIAGLIYKKVKS